MTNAPTLSYRNMLLPLLLGLLILLVSPGDASAAPALQDNDANAGTAILPTDTISTETPPTDTVDSDTKSAIDFIMYLRSQPRDTDACAMMVEDGALVIDPAITNPAMTCPDMFAWKLFVDAIQDEFWANWAPDQYTFPQEGPLPLCAADATDGSACCTPGGESNPGYDDPDNPGHVCPYFPGDHLADDVTPNTLEANTLAIEQDSHFRTPAPAEGVEAGRVIRQEMAEVVFRNKPMFDYLFENNLYNTDGLAEVFSRASAAMQLGAPYHQENVPGELVKIDLPIDSVMIKTNWIHESRAAELGITDDPENPYIKMTLNAKAIDNNADIFEPGVHYLVAFHVSSKDTPNWVWATFEHVNNPGRCDMTGCNDSYGYQTPDPVQPGQATNYIAPHQQSDNLLIPTTIFDQGKRYAGDVRTPELAAIFTALSMGSSNGAGEVPAPGDSGWLSYRLKGSQTEFVDPTGRPTLLGNSVTEGGFVTSSSCIACHARASIAEDGSAAIAVFEPELAEDGYAQSTNGAPDPDWFFTNASHPTLLALPFDFVWGILFAQPLATGESTGDDTASDDTASDDTDSVADPFAYCADVGTIDAPQGNFGDASNPGVPAAVAVGLRTASGSATDAPIEMFEQNSYWRCADGQVYACFVGANLPCTEKANTSTTPTDAMTGFCADQPDADAIPAAVTGRATVYDWRCIDGEAEAGEQIFDVDAQGYLANFWYAIDQDGAGE